MNDQSGIVWQFYNGYSQVGLMQIGLAIEMNKQWWISLVMMGVRKYSSS